MICFDSDALTNPGVHEAAARLMASGAGAPPRGARVAFAYLPAADDGSKLGVDDYLAAGHTRDDLLARVVVDEWRPLPSAPRAPAEPDVPLEATGKLIAEVAALVDRFVILPSRASALTIALWVMHTHAFAAAHATPYLVIASPSKRSGKTRLQEVLELVVRAPWRIAAASESVVSGKIADTTPTLLLDEVDALRPRSRRHRADPRTLECRQPAGRGRCPYRWRRRRQRRGLHRVLPEGARRHRRRTVARHDHRPFDRRRPRPQEAARARRAAAPPRPARRDGAAARRARAVGGGARRAAYTTPSWCCPTSLTIAPPKGGSRCSRFASLLTGSTTKDGRAARTRRQRSSPGQPKTTREASRRSPPCAPRP